MNGNDINLSNTMLDDTVMTGVVSSDALDSRSLTELLMSQGPQVRRKGFGIMLYMPAVRDPLELWNMPNITLGRQDIRQKVYPTVDLTPYHAIQLGVSRMHAQIVFRNGGFYVYDLGSKNGTWVNKVLVGHKQALPITHRDTLRIGHLMIHIGACQYS